MKNKQFLLVVGCLVLLMISCRVNRQVLKTVTTENNIQKEVSYKDTTLVVKGSKTALVIPKSELIFKSELNNSANKVNLSLKNQKQLKKRFQKFKSKNGQANVNITQDNNNLYVDCECDTLAIKAQLKSVYERQEKIKEVHSKQKVERVTGISVFKVLLYVISALTIGFVAGYVTKALSKIKTTLPVWLSGFFKK